MYVRLTVDVVFVFMVLVYAGICAACMYICTHMHTQIMCTHLHNRNSGLLPNHTLIQRQQRSIPGALHSRKMVGTHRSTDPRHKRRHFGKVPQCRKLALLRLPVAQGHHAVYPCTDTSRENTRYSVCQYGGNSSHANDHDGATASWRLARRNGGNRRAGEIPEFERDRHTVFVRGDLPYRAAGAGQRDHDGRGG